MKIREADLRPSLEWGIDVYKLNMQPILFQFTDHYAYWKMTVRTKRDWHPQTLDLVRELVDELDGARLPESTLNYLGQKSRYLTPRHLSFMRSVELHSDAVDMIWNDNQPLLMVGDLVPHASLWETMLISMVIEADNFLSGRQIPDNAIEDARMKAKQLQEMGAKWADFGTRRRFSRTLHQQLYEAALEYASVDGGPGLVGTSCVGLAEATNTTPIGTMAHELFMLHAAVFGYQQAESKVLEAWMREFDGKLGIVLPDTYTTDHFLTQMRYMYAMAFDGFRHDSGDPLEFFAKIYSFYANLGINPKSKTIVWSDGLNLSKVAKILNFVNGQMKSSFGIGTHFTNDFGFGRYDIVMKLAWLQQVNSPFAPIPACKLSDDPGKATGDPRAIDSAHLLLGLAV